MNLSLIQRVCLIATTTIGIMAFAPAANAQFSSVTGPQIAVNTVAFPDAGATQENSMVQPFAFSFNGNQQRASGSVTSAVYRNTNNFLDFVYQINVTEATGGVTAINITDFGSFTTASAFDRSDDIDGAGAFTAGGLAPYRSGRPSPGGLQFTFNASGEGDIITGNKSALLLVRTNSTTFSTGTGAVSAQASGNVLVFAPSSGVIVPEAGTLVLLLPGIALGMVAVTRRKK